MPEDCPQGIADLWRSCIVRDPEARPSAAVVQATLEALLPLQRGQQPQPALPAEPAAASASDALAFTQPHTPPQTHASAAGCIRR